VSALGWPKASSTIENDDLTHPEGVHTDYLPKPSSTIGNVHPTHPVGLAKGQLNNKIVEQYSSMFMAGLLEGC